MGYNELRVLLFPFYSFTLYLMVIREMVIISFPMMLIYVSSALFSTEAAWSKLWPPGETEPTGNEMTWHFHSTADTYILAVGSSLSAVTPADCTLMAYSSNMPAMSL